MKKYKLEHPITLGIRDFGGTSIICYNPNNLELCKILSDPNINGRGPHPYTLGGSVDYDNILSQNGNCLIARNSRVLGKNIKIEDNARILGKSTIYTDDDKIIIKDNTQVIDSKISNLNIVKQNNSIYILNNTIIKNSDIDCYNCRNAVVVFDNYTIIDNITLNFYSTGTEQNRFYIRFYNTYIQNCSDYIVVMSICKSINICEYIKLTNKIIEDYIQNYKEIECSINDSILAIPYNNILIYSKSNRLFRKIYDLNQFINYYNIQK